MSTKIRVYGQIIERDGRFCCPFRSHAEGYVPSTSVSLARNPDHCFFNLENLAEHDSHMPSFSSYEEAAKYRRRVLVDFACQIEGEIATIGIYDGVTPDHMPEIEFGG